MVAVTFEDDFDAALRENFIIVLLWAGCFCLGAWILYMRNRREEAEEPLLSVSLSATSLSFCLLCLLVLPLDQSIQIFTGAVRWFGINGERFSRRLASVAFFGSNISLFLLNPFAYLFSEAQDGTWRSFWTTMLEVGLLLAMLFSLGMLFFTRATVSDMLLDPYHAFSKLASLLAHIPGCLIVLYESAEALVHPVQEALFRFVPWKREVQDEEDARRVRRELEAMQRTTATHTRRGSGLRAVADLQEEIARIERASGNYLLLRNLEASVSLFIRISFTLMIVFRCMIPSSTANALIQPRSVLWSLVLPSYFSWGLWKAWNRHPYIERFFSSRTDSTTAPSSGIGASSLRTSSAGSLTGLNSSLSLAKIVGLCLITSSSVVVVLTGMFDLKLAFKLPSHPLLLSPAVSVPYCGILALRALRGLWSAMIGSKRDAEDSDDDLPVRNFLASDKVQ